jgi:Zn/Cd-binding protein ZinT
VSYSAEGEVYSFLGKQGKEYTFKCHGKDERKGKCILFSKNRVKSTLSIVLARMSERKSVFFSLKTG